jgi:transketolase
MRSPEKLSMRDTFAETVCALGAERPELVVLDADVSKSTYTRAFGQAYPARFINVGIAEQNMMSIAAGLASAGMTPLVASFSMLLSLRALDQVRQSICYPRQNVKLMAHYGGLSSGPEGPTHQAIEDLGVMRALPNMTVVVPADAAEVRSALRAVVAYDGPVFFRMCRNALPKVYDTPPVFTIGKGSVLRQGGDVTIVANGVMVANALDAAEELAGAGISARVLAMPTLKPFDAGLVAQAARETGAIVAAEEHNIYGGLASAVAEALALHAPAPMERVGIQDTFAESGDYFELLKKYGLDTPDIVRAAHKVLTRKSGLH